jgi:hypothetical protein
MAPQPVNPFREAFEAWEQPTAAFWEAALRSPLLLQGLNQGLTWSLGWQRAARQALDATWRLWGLPTRGEVELAQHQINQLRAEVQRLAQALDDRIE